MSEKTDFGPYFVRLLVVFAVSVLFVAIFNEVAYLLQREPTDRAPKTVQILVPAGTAAQIAEGGAVPSIPEEMSFVVGDVLEVKNEDSENHQLGPLWVPPGTSARLVLTEPNQFAFSCSFQPSRYLNLDVRQATTLTTRMTALIVAAPTTAAFLYIYSLLVFPIRSRKKTGETATRQA
jgi:hypothetical protein